MILDPYDPSTETKVEYLQRVTRYFQWIVYRLPGESAEDHYTRFTDFERSPACSIFMEPADWETFTTRSYLHRIDVFVNKSKEIMEKFDNDLFQRMKPVPHNEAKNAQLARVDNMLAMYSSYIDIQRVRIRETDQEFVARRNRFYSFRNQIEVAIAIKPLEEKYNNSINLATEVEKAKLAVRAKDASDCIDKLNKFEKKRKANKTFYGVYRIFMFVVLVGVLFLAVAFVDGFITDLKVTGWVIFAMALTFVSLAILPKIIRR